MNAPDDETTIFDRLLWHISDYKVLKKKPDRNRYLHRRTGHQAEPAPGLEARIAAADRLMRQTFDAGHRSHIHPFLAQEAAASSGIENVFDEEPVQRHEAALRKFLAVKVTKTSLLAMHRTIMRGQPQSQPGQVRTYNVRVGNYRAPDHERAPALLDAALRYMTKTPDPPPVAAAWAHAQFESVHPFCDGNGRTGRAIIQQMLQAPLPISVWILEHQQAYYSRLGGGYWEGYLKWFLEGIEDTCRIIQQDRFPEYAARVLAEARANRPQITCYDPPGPPPPRDHK